MAVIRTHAMDKLIAILTEAVPELADHICKMGEPHLKRTWPTLQIIPIRFRYYPQQEHEHKGLSHSVAVFDVGRHQGTIQLRLGANTPAQRWDLEDKILNVFLSQEGRPGVLVTTIEEVHDAVVAWELEDDEWNNEKVFTKEFYSILTVRAQIPALITREGVYTIEAIRLSLTEDLSTEFTDLPTSAIETVEIDEDGNLTPL